MSHYMHTPQSCPCMLPPRLLHIFRYQNTKLLYLLFSLPSCFVFLFFSNFCSPPPLSVYSFNIFLHLFFFASPFPLLFFLLFYFMFCCYSLFFFVCIPCFYTLAFLFFSNFSSPPPLSVYSFNIFLHLFFFFTFSSSFSYSFASCFAVIFYSLFACIPCFYTLAPLFFMYKKSCTKLYVD